MKKRIFLFLVVLFVIQTASATITLDGLSSVYNKGEIVEIKGTILEDTKIDGQLEFKLQCGNLILSYPKVSIKIDANTPKSYSIPNFQINPAVEDECYINISLLSQEIIIEEKLSDNFTISKDLNGEFTIYPIQVQLGKSFTLYGRDIFNLNDKSVTGTAEIFFKKDDEKFYVKNVKVNDGILEFVYDTSQKEPGEYMIGVLVNDLLGNKKLFEDVVKFTIVDEIYIFVEPFQSKVKPGETIRIVGEARTILREIIKEGFINIILDDQIYATGLKDSVFSYDLKLSENIKTGKHTMYFSIDDPDGNWGNTDRSLNIEAIPTELTLTSYQDSVRPGDVLEIMPMLYDQANEFIKEDISVALTNPNGATIFLSSVTGNDKLAIGIPQFSIPGVWTIKAAFGDLIYEEEVQVEEVEKIETRIVNDTLYVTNLGNVDYNKPITLNFNGDEFTLIRKISISPNETTIIDLSKEVPSGQYDVGITGAAIVGTTTFNDVVIFGKNKKSLNIIYSILLILLIASLAYLIIFKKRNFETTRGKIERENRLAKVQLQKLRDAKEKERSHTVFNREESIKDFRERVLKDIRETESKSSPSEQKKEEPSSGLFSMFN